MSDDPIALMQAVEEQKHLQRNLKDHHIQLIAIGSTIGTDPFTGSDRTVHLTGPSLLLIYLFIGAILFLVMRTMGELLLHNLEHKSFQNFARDMLGPQAGYFVGWTHWILWVVTTSVEVVVIASYFDFWIKDMT